MREGGCVDQEPLRLAIRARGVGGDASTKETPPPSRVSSKGGGGSSNTTKVASVGSQ